MYVFQEESTREGDSSAGLGDVLSSLIPGQHSWNIHQVVGCAIATPLPLTPIPSDSERYASAVVTLPSGKRLLVVSVHLKCCGYAGSEEDHTRASQAEQLAKLIKSERGQNDGVVVDLSLIADGTQLVENAFFETRQ